jgi:hypothetical protein
MAKEKPILENMVLSKCFFVGKNDINIEKLEEVLKNFISQGRFHENKDVSEFIFNNYENLDFKTHQYEDDMIYYIDIQDFVICLDDILNLNKYAKKHSSIGDKIRLLQTPKMYYQFMQKSGLELFIKKKDNIKKQQRITLPSTFNSTVFPKYCTETRQIYNIRHNKTDYPNEELRDEDINIQLDFIRKEVIDAKKRYQSLNPGLKLRQILGNNRILENINICEDRGFIKGFNFWTPEGQKIYVKNHKTEYLQEKLGFNLVPHCTNGFTYTDTNQASDKCNSDVISHLITRGDITVVYGGMGTGKTFNTTTAIGQIRKGKIIKEIPEGIDNTKPMTEDVIKVAHNAAQCVITISTRINMANSYVDTFQRNADIELSNYKGRNPEDFTLDSDFVVNNVSLYKSFVTEPDHHKLENINIYDRITDGNHDFILYLDEVNALMDAVFDKTHDEVIAGGTLLNYYVLSTLIKKATKLVISGADIRKFDLDMIKEIRNRPNDIVSFYGKESIVDSSITTTNITSEESWQHLLFEQIFKLDRNIAIPCDSEKDARKLKNTLFYETSKNCKNIEVILYTAKSENSMKTKTELVRMFLDAYLEGKTVVFIYTSKCGNGTSIEFDKNILEELPKKYHKLSDKFPNGFFYHCFPLLKEDGLSVTDSVQLFLRIRKFINQSLDEQEIPTIVTHIKKSSTLSRFKTYPMPEWSFSPKQLHKSMFESKFITRHLTDFFNITKQFFIIRFLVISYFFELRF